MSEENASNPLDSLSAKERIVMLENRLGQIEMDIYQRNTTINNLRDTVLLLDSKFNALSELANFTNDQVKDKIIDHNVLKLKERITDLVNQNIIQASETLTDPGIVIGQEFDGNGVMINPRIQIPTVIMKPDFKDKILGAKVGDELINYDGEGRTLKVLEVYAAVIPALPEAEAPVQEQLAVESAPAEVSAPVEPSTVSEEPSQV